MKHSVHSKVVGMVAFKSLAIEKSINQRLPSFFARPACNAWQERERESVGDQAYVISQYVCVSMCINMCICICLNYIQTEFK